MCCSLLAASIYGLSRECRENLNIRCMRKWFWIKQAVRKPHNSCSPGPRHAIKFQCHSFKTPMLLQMPPNFFLLFLKMSFMKTDSIISIRKFIWLLVPDLSVSTEPRSVFFFYFSADKLPRYHHCTIVASRLWQSVSWFPSRVPLQPLLNCVCVARRPFFPSNRK